MPTRELIAGDELLVNDLRIKVAGRSDTLPRFPPPPLLYTSSSNAARILPVERHLLIFVPATAQPGVSPPGLAQRIQQQTCTPACSAEDFKSGTIYWYRVDFEDVGDMAALLTLAMSAGLGLTGVMFYKFSHENLSQYAVLKAMGATSRLLLTMIFVPAGICALLCTGIGLGLCGLAGGSVSMAGYPFRMIWFTDPFGTIGALIVSLTAALISARPVLKLQPAVVFAGR